MTDKIKARRRNSILLLNTWTRCCCDWSYSWRLESEHNRSTEDSSLRFSYPTYFLLVKYRNYPYRLEERATYIGSLPRVNRMLSEHGLTAILPIGNTSSDLVHWVHPAVISTSLGDASPSPSRRGENIYFCWRLVISARSRLCICYEND